MSNTKKSPTYKVVLKNPKKVLGFIAHGQNVHDQMAAHATLFPSPDPALSVLQTHIDDVSAKNAAAKTRAVGTVAARIEAEKVLAGDLETERAYVEKVVNQNPENAESIAQNAGMALRKNGPKSKPPLAAKRGTLAGSVDLVAKAEVGAKAYDWQYSIDAGKTWVDAPPTTRAKVSVPNLAIAATVLFRHRPITKAGPGDWSQPLTYVVS